LSDEGKLWAASRNMPRVNIAGVSLVKGDLVDVWLNLRGLPERYTFIAFNPHLFTFHFLDHDSGEVILIPYKSIKKMRVIKNKSKRKKSKVEDEG